MTTLRPSQIREEIHRGVEKPQKLTSRIVGMFRSSIILISNKWDGQFLKNCNIRVVT